MPGMVAIENNRTPQQWSGVKYAYRDARRYASLRGLTLRGTTKIWDSSLAGIGMEWAKQQGDAVLRQLHRSRLRTVLETGTRHRGSARHRRDADGSGADTDGFADYSNGEGRSGHDATQQQIFAAGIFGVPSYVVAGELFFGREHLPMVRWLLTGKRGRAARHRLSALSHRQRRLARASIERAAPAR